jgi:hypothetical protein
MLPLGHDCLLHLVRLAKPCSTAAAYAVVCLAKSYPKDILIKICCEEKSQ